MMGSWGEGEAKRGEGWSENPRNSREASRITTGYWRRGAERRTGSRQRSVVRQPTAAASPSHRTDAHAAHAAAAQPLTEGSPNAQKARQIRRQSSKQTNRQTNKQTNKQSPHLRRLEAAAYKRGAHGSPQHCLEVRLEAHADPLPPTKEQPLRRTTYSAKCMRRAGALLQAPRARTHTPGARTQTCGGAQAPGSAHARRTHNTATRPGQRSGSGRLQSSQAPRGAEEAPAHEASCRAERAAHPSEIADGLDRRFAPPQHDRSPVPASRALPPRRQSTGSSGRGALPLCSGRATSSRGSRERTRLAALRTAAAAVPRAAAARRCTPERLRARRQRAPRAARGCACSGAQCNC
jgi:hypothetical protein